MCSSEASSRRLRRRRVDSTNSALIDAVSTLRKPRAMTITTVATSRPAVDVGTLSP